MIPLPSQRAADWAAALGGGVRDGEGEALGGGSLNQRRGAELRDARRGLGSDAGA